MSEQQGSGQFSGGGELINRMAQVVTAVEALSARLDVSHGELRTDLAAVQDTVAALYDKLMALETRVREITGEP
jgi:hypothetical protein